VKAFSVNSALAFAIAMLVTAAIHETGHGLAAQSLGFFPKIYAFYEDNPAGTAAQNLIILAAGPLTSLLVGLLCMAVLYRTTPRYSFWRLLLFWFAWLGIMEFVNYLIVTPWLTMGDTAQIANILHWPTAARYGIALVGIAFLIVLSKPAAATMFSLAPSGVPLQSGSERRRYIMRGFYLPLLAGTVLTALGGIGTNPLNLALGLLGTLGNIDVIALALYRVKDARVQETLSAAPLRVEPAALLLFAVVVAFYDVFLPRGLPV
jgi:hypothetical protein